MHGSILGHDCTAYTLHRFPFYLCRFYLHSSFNSRLITLFSCVKHPSIVVEGLLGCHPNLRLT